MTTKLQLADTMQDVVFKMSEGNPGALTVCLNTLKKGGKIDPDNSMGGFGALMTLDSLGIYGSKIWMLYKDACNCHLPVMLAVLRGFQHGMLSKTQVFTAVENCGAGISVEDVCSEVVK